VPDYAAAAAGSSGVSFSKQTKVNTHVRVRGSARLQLICEISTYKKTM